MPRKSLKPAIALSAIVLGVAALYLAGNYRRHDLEKLPMNDQARRGVEGSFIQLPHGVTHYQIAGAADARTVVLVHGFSVPYFIWDQAYDPLVQAGFRVLRYDLYGRGFSDRPNVEYDADLFDAQLLDLLSGLHIQGPVDVVGVSMGGAISVIFTARHPEKVRTLTLFDPAYSTGEAPPWFLRPPLVGEYLMCVKIAPALPDSQKDDFVHPERYPGYFAHYRVQMLYRGFRHAILSTVRLYLSRDDRPDYEAVGRTGRPVLLYWGQADQDVPFSVSNEVRHTIPQAEFHPLEDAAHLPFYEHPEITNPVLVEFLRGH
jgi:pimeloyl-ACP methyl ester carboxylesterase